MIECADPATCEQLAAQMEVIVTYAVVSSVAIVVLGKVVWDRYSNDCEESV